MGREQVIRVSLCDLFGLGTPCRLSSFCSLRAPVFFKCSLPLRPSKVKTWRSHTLLSRPVACTTTRPLNSDTCRLRSGRYARLALLNPFVSLLLFLHGSYLKHPPVDCEYYPLPLPRPFNSAFEEYKHEAFKMSLNVKVQNQPQQATLDKTNLQSLHQNPHRAHKAGGGSRAGSINLTVEQRKSWRYPPEFWDRLSSISLTRTALEELDRRNKGLNQPCSLLPPAKPAQGVSRFARHGGPSLCHLRGYQPRARAVGSFLRSQQAPSADTTNKTAQHKNTTIFSTHDRNFEQHLTDNNIYPIWRSQKPDLEIIFAALAAPGLSLSHSQFPADLFETFLKSNLQARNEDDIFADVIPTIIGPRDVNWPIARNTTLKHLEPLTDGTIPLAKPDFTYGALPEQLDPTIHTKLGRFIAPGPGIPIVPNFFLEVKGPNGSAAVNTQQACYNGAIGARAMHQLQNYGREQPIYDGRSYAFSSTYHDGTLKLYAHHLTAPATRGGQPEYHMTQLDTWAITGNVQSFTAGVTAFRNLRDLAKQHRDTFIQQANSRYQQGAAAAE